MENNLETMRHSCAHILAAAIKHLYGEKAKLAIGPAIEDGFYYDFDFAEDIKVSEADFPKIEAEMKKIQDADIKLVREEKSIDEAIEIIKKQNEPYRAELVEDLKKSGETEVSFYNDDLCAGPHVESTGKVGPFKLLSVAGAYWRGSEKNKMLTRIYGTCFPTQKELDDYLNLLEEAKKRDHRVIGKQQDLFSFHSEAPGDIFWHDKGYRIFRQLLAYWREVHDREGYLEVRTPEILTREVWDRSGHTGFFINKMYQVTTPDSEEPNMMVKPMNCDGGILIYKNKPRSYKDFPLKMGEIGVVHRFEASGEIHGIFRPREFTQDDAHIFCTPEQVKDEIKKVMDLCFEVYKTFGLEIDHLELSTRPEKSIGSKEIWDRAEEIMRQILTEKGIPYRINEGDGAFYGPKFDFHLKDVIGRTWQCSTIQLDFAQPENFELEYTTAAGNKERPVMIHRVLYGSVERFYGILIEHYAGAFPVWLAPVQVVILPITDKENEYAGKLLALLNKEGVRGSIDDRRETMGSKIRDAEMQKVPYLIVIGGREEKSGTVNVRRRGEQVLGEMSFEEFLTLIKQDIAKKRQI